MSKIKDNKFLKILCGFLLTALLLIVLFFGFLSLTEYKPGDYTSLDIDRGGTKELSAGDSVTLLSWNIGYGALGDNADFFMDGGKSVITADEERVNSNMDDIEKETASVNPDIFMVQEIDLNSRRSRHVNEYARMRESLKNYDSSFANNFKVAFLPYPWPPLGKVDSGISTFSKYAVKDAARVQLPIPFSWPVRMVNLKRCLLVSRIPIKDSDSELVIFNLHLEAYDNNEGKREQTKVLSELLLDEVEKGNSVIAGGDFNQIFSNADNGQFDVKEGLWAPARVETDSIKGSWQFLMDNTVPSCRSIDREYAGADHNDFQYYLIDGFIVSSDIKVKELANQDLGFKCSDHNPVLLKVTLPE